MTRLRLLCLFALVSVAAYAQREMTVAQLTAFVKSSVQLHQSDSEVAKILRGIKLTNKLEDQTVEDLQNLGAGPRTVAALRTLSDESANLAPPPPPAPKPAVTVLAAPDAAAQKKILDEVRGNALNYTKNLPNFICTQVTTQHVDPAGGENWQTVGRIQEHLSYVDGKEDYKVIMVDDHPVANLSHVQVKGNKSSGEFGTMLAEIFDPESRTDFNWDHWATWRGRLTYVFSFRVPQPYSKYQILDEESGRSIVPGYHGLIYADRDTGMVMRITMNCDNIPPDFPVQQASETLDYGFQKIADREFVLPLKAEMHSRNGRMTALNEIEFRLYRKFGTESSITFDTSDAGQPDQTNQPGAAPAAPQNPPPAPQK